MADVISINITSASVTGNHRKRGIIHRGDTTKSQILRGAEMTNCESFIPCLEEQGSGA